MISILTEGKGERKSGPQLVRRILYYLLSEYEIQPTSKALAARGKGDLIKDFENLLRLSFRRDDCEGVLVIVDSDDCCAERLAKDLAARAKAIALGPVAVVCPVEEFENWFICSAESICPSSAMPADCEHYGNPKGWLNECLQGGYRSTLHQAQLVWKIDFELALPRSRSLRRMVNAISQLSGAIRSRKLIFTP